MSHNLSTAHGDRWRENAMSGLELPSSVTTRVGAVFDPRGKVWQFRDSTADLSMDFSTILGSDSLVDAAKMVLIWYAQNRSGHHVHNLFQRFQHFCKILSLDSDFSEIQPNHLINYRSQLSQRDSWYFSSLSGLLKRWYRLGYAGVSKAAFELLCEFRNRGNLRGEAILTLDPYSGPFSDIELATICSKLDDAYEKGEVKITQYALVLLYISLGQRSVQYSLLKLEDFRVQQSASGEVEYMLRIPRAKQRNQVHRTQFKERLLIEKVGLAIKRQCQLVKRKHKNTLSDVSQMPIFPAHESRRNEPPGYEFHRTSDSLNITLKQTVSKLGIASPSTGQPLNITSTRFRRTVGTRAAVEGHGELVIAEMLDHTDTQSVGVYVKSRPEIVDRIDRAVALELAPLAQAFAGVIVEGEAKARRGGEPGSRIIDPSIAPIDKPMGTCGQHGFCGFMAPIACYTCRNFQPWLDGPHEHVLEFLLSERERLSTESDLRIASINDNTILAVAQVIQSCSDINSKKKMRLT